MAKKHCGKNITHWYKFLLYGYECGIWQSAILHTLFLLVLSLIVIYEPNIKPIKIALSFTNNNDSEIVSLNKIQNIDIVEEKTISIEEYETINIEDAIPAGIVDIKFDQEDYSNNLKNESLNIKDLISSIENKRNDNNFIEQNTSNTTNDIIKSISTSIEQAASHQNNNPNINSGNSDEFSRRLSLSGAKTGDVQVSIMWQTTDDIDLHVSYTLGNGVVDNINWTNRIGRISYGMLDVDRNASSDYLVNDPVENIFWQKGSTPKGFFIVFIHFYRSWTGNNKVPVLARIKIGNEFQEIKCMAILYQSPQEIARFKFDN